MTPNPTYRGQPVVALVLVLGGWVAMRAMMWDAVALAPDGLPQFASFTREDAEPSVRPMPAPAPPERARYPGDRPAPRRLLEQAGRNETARSPVWQTRPLPASVPDPAPPAGVSVQATAAHQLMWMAAVSQIPLPVAALLPRSPPAPAAFYPVGREPAQRTRRWSGDAWLLLREGSQAALSGTTSPATYGASQAGAVIRYRLAPASDHRPAAYLRATAALGGMRDRQAAAGISARPFARVPIVAAAEVRLTDQGGGNRARPAIMAVTELPQFPLPAGFRGEAYAQAGWVGGRNATAFADGQMRAERAVAKIGRGELRAGGGVWGGAQKGAARLDIGPSATLGVAVSDNAAARVAVDWRLRVAGDARPGSGPALTLSAGF